MTGRRGRRRRKLLDDLKDRRGYCHLKEEALDRTMWRDLLEEALDLSSDRILNEVKRTLAFQISFYACSCKSTSRQMGYRYSTLKERIWNIHICIHTHTHTHLSFFL